MKSKYRNISIILIALVPVFIHILLLGISFKNNAYTPTGKFDLLIFLIIFIYLLIISFICHYKKTLFVLFVYSIILAFIFVEINLQFLNLNSRFVSRPIHRISYAAPGVMLGISGKIELTVNQYGLRGPKEDFRKADFKILAVGGSSTECLYVTDKLTWPWRLQDKLSRRLSQHVFVGNSGRSGHLTLTHLYLHDFVKNQL